MTGARPATARAVRCAEESVARRGSRLLHGLDHAALGPPHRAPDRARRRAVAARAGRRPHRCRRGRVRALCGPRALTALAKSDDQPPAPLDTSGGIDSRVIRLRGDGRTETAWLRRRRPGGEVLYAGLYAIARPPLAAGPCAKVAFPLPNGNASVFLDPVARPDGSLELVSSARSFGDAGFYFVVVRDEATVWARHVPQLEERIHVYCDEQGEVHTDHRFWLWGRVFLRLHHLCAR